MDYTKELAAVKVGDVVVADTHYEAMQYQVSRITQTQIVCGDRRFNRKTGREVGGDYSSYSSLRLIFGNYAKQRAAECRFQRAWRRLRDNGQEGNAATVTAIRAAADEMEAALRELGKWEAA